MSPQITYVGDEAYHGVDQGNDNQPVNLEPGDSAEVSEEKADQLRGDRPHDFEIDGRAAEPRPEPQEHEDEDAPAEGEPSDEEPQDGTEEASAEVEDAPQDPESDSAAEEPAAPPAEEEPAKPKGIRRRRKG